VMMRRASVLNGDDGGGEGVGDGGERVGGNEDRARTRKKIS